MKGRAISKHTAASTARAAGSASVPPERSRAGHGRRRGQRSSGHSQGIPRLPVALRAKLNCSLSKIPREEMP